MSNSDAIEFLMSGRGRYIMAQALHYGIQSLESVEPEVMQEKSNIEDMKYLRDNLFNYPDALFETEYLRGSEVPSVMEDARKRDIRKPQPTDAMDCMGIKTREYHSSGNCGVTHEEGAVMDGSTIDHMKMENARKRDIKKVSMVRDEI